MSNLKDVGRSGKQSLMQYSCHVVKDVITEKMTIHVTLLQRFHRV